MTIDEIRAKFPENPPLEDSVSLLETFWAERLADIQSSTVPGAGGVTSVKDIDMSTGFDMFLILVVIPPS